MFSCSKNLTAVAVALLVDRGLLAYTDLVTTHWPEYDGGQEGKSEVRCRYLDFGRQQLFR